MHYSLKPFTMKKNLLCLQENYVFKDVEDKPEMVSKVFKTSTWEAEAGRSLCSLFKASLVYIMRGLGYSATHETQKIKTNKQKKIRR